MKKHSYLLVGTSALLYTIAILDFGRYLAMILKAFLRFIFPFNFHVDQNFSSPEEAVQFPIVHAGKMPFSFQRKKYPAFLHQKVDLNLGAIGALHYVSRNWNNNAIRAVIKSGIPPDLIASNSCGFNIENLNFS